MAATVTAKLKWGKQAFDLSVDPAAGVAALKLQLQALTGVPVERQKLSCPKAWKGNLAPDGDLAKLANGASMLLMGTADVMAAQLQQVVFVEDMKAEEVAAVSLPAGFQNLGNTCYMNSTLQALRVVPELREGLAAAGSGGGGGDPALAAALKGCLEGADRQTAAFAPHGFWQALKQRYPTFAATTPQGHPMQQDAEELFSQTTASLATVLRAPTGLPDLGGASNLVDALFGLEMVTTDTCDECPEAEAPKVGAETSRKLVVNITGGNAAGAAVTGNVDHLHEGVKLGLTTSIEMNSAVLNRNALWTRTTRANRLPRYICVQFMRFYAKTAAVVEEGREVVKTVKCKIMRPVSFPEVLDVYDFCTPKVQAALKANRDRHGDEMLGDLKKPAAAAAMETTEDAPAAAEAMDEDEAALQEALQLSMGSGGASAAAGASAGAAVGPGLPADFMGNYEVFALVTHKGRLADGGHYMGWVRQDGDDWLVFNDDEVSPCKTETVMQLKGGGDSDMAYLAFYRFKN